MEAVNKIKEILLTVSEHAYHHFAQEATHPEYIVYAEDSTGNALYSNNIFEDRTIEGTIDLFTKDADSYTTFYAVEAALRKEKVPFRLNTIQFEHDTGYKHYEWVWQWYG